MKKLIPAAAILASVALAAPALADYGAGQMSYAEWLNVNQGQTRNTVENNCNCSGTVMSDVGGVRVVWYDSPALGRDPHTEEYYVLQSGGAWRTEHSYWCTNGNCNKAF